MHVCRASVQRYFSQDCRCLAHGGCAIEGNCYEDGQFYSSQLVCDTSKDITAWSEYTQPERGFSCLDNECEKP